MLNNTLNSTLENNNKSLVISDVLYPKVATGVANGTFGELLQGVLPNQEHFLVTFPITCCTRSIVILDSCYSELEVYPSSKVKSLKLAKEVISLFNIKVNGKIIIKSDLEQGKGLASSSADIIATARAMERALNIKIHDDVLLNILRSIEPSDGVMYNGIVSFYHRKVKLLEHLGHLPQISVIAIDEGGILDTIEYNAREREFSQQDMFQYNDLLNNISIAIKNSDLCTIGKISTKSAIMNQRYNPKKYLEEMLEICQDIGGLGVIVAHSGTYIGIMIEKNNYMYETKLNRGIFFMSKISTNIRIYESLSSEIIEGEKYEKYL